MNSVVLDIILSFARGIGLQIEYDNNLKESETFLPGVAIEDGGGIRFKDGVMMGDLLHEIGHIALFPSRYRYLLKKAHDNSIDIDYAIQEICLKEWGNTSEVIAPEILYYSDQAVGGYSFLLCRELQIDCRLSYDLSFIPGDEGCGGRGG